MRQAHEQGASVARAAGRRRASELCPPIDSAHFLFLLDVFDCAERGRDGKYHLEGLEAKFGEVCGGEFFVRVWEPEEQIRVSEASVV